MTSEYRRGACPEVLHPMETGDGLLARVPAREAALALDAWLGLAAAARAHGNGFLEVTRRGNVQVRGLRPESVDDFAAALVERGIAIEGGPAIQSNPLAGHDASEVLDARPIAAALRARIAASPWRAQLGPKVSFAIDGGGALHLDGIDADLRLRALPRSRWHVLAGGDGRSAHALGTVACEHAVEALARLAEAIAQRGPLARARDVIEREGSEALSSTIRDRLGSECDPCARAAADPIGVHALRGGRVAIGIGLAFGQSDAAALERWVRAAAKSGASSMAPAEQHGLLALGVDPAHTDALRAEAHDAGFITRRDDPRRHVSACSGAPACAAAQMTTRARADAVARAAAPLLDGSVRIHLSGCAKGCAHPGPATLTFAGVSEGCGFIFADRARREPLARFASATLEARVARLAAHVQSKRDPHERSAHTLARIGEARLAEMLLEPSVP
jgi:precorrin-3B synthase